MALQARPLTRRLATQFLASRRKAGSASIAMLRRAVCRKTRGCCYIDGSSPAFSNLLKGLTDEV